MLRPNDRVAAMRGFQAIMKEDYSKDMYTQLALPFLKFSLNRFIYSKVFDELAKFRGIEIIVLIKLKNAIKS